MPKSMLAQGLPPGSMIQTQNHRPQQQCPDPVRGRGEAPWPLATLPDSTFAESGRPNLISIFGFHFPPRATPPCRSAAFLSIHVTPPVPLNASSSRLFLRDGLLGIIFVFIYNGLESSLKCFPGAERWESLFQALKSPVRM